MGDDECLGRGAMIRQCPRFTTCRRELAVDARYGAKMAERGR